MATSKKMAVVMVFMAAVLLLATVESAAAATATPSDSNQQLGLGATRKLLQIFKDTCGGQGCSSSLDCCLASPLCNGNICSTILQ
ncbi:unnamed protein product [Miscanthus lutarioriparius]|uniref:Uncharacterized protein n=1 Tax=Miscanthus lutarioriparius TaxID=422564 RepID=A0A811SHQ6_9POAL|nr:unnamed protein product [Miscanthus lutarioriparius]